MVVHYRHGHDIDRFRAGQYLTSASSRSAGGGSHRTARRAEQAPARESTIKYLGDHLPRLDCPSAHGPSSKAPTAISRPNTTADRALLVAGGIGVTPLRAILEELAGRIPCSPLYRARHPRDLVFKHELDILRSPRTSWSITKSARGGHGEPTSLSIPIGSSGSCRSRPARGVPLWALGVHARRRGGGTRARRSSAPIHLERFFDD